MNKNNKANHNQNFTSLSKVTFILGAISILGYIITIKSDLGMSTSSFGNLIAALGMYSVLVALLSLIAIFKAKDIKNRVLSVVVLLLCIFVSSAQLLGAALINQ